MLEDIIARLVDKVENRYYGKYRGTVIDNADPQDIGRIKASVPRLLADKETGWALPAVPYGGAGEQGGFAIPDVGAAVWIEFEGGELAFPIWTGTWWGTGEVPEGAKPDKKVFKTKAGHKIVLDDTSGSEAVEVLDSNNNDVKLDSNGIAVTDANNNTVKMTSSGIEMTDANNNSIKMTSSGIEFKDANGNSIKMESSGITATNGSMSLKITASGVNVNDTALQVM